MAVTDHFQGRGQGESKVPEESAKNANIPSKELPRAVEGPPRVSAPDSAPEVGEGPSQAGTPQADERPVQVTRNSPSDPAQVIVSEFGTFLGKKSERLIIKRMDQGGKKRIEEQIPFRDISSLIIEGSGISFSADVIKECVEHGIQVDFLDYSGKPYAKLTSPALSATVVTRREQLMAYNDRRGVRLGQAFVSGKLQNQAALLVYFSRYRETADQELFEEMQDIASRIQSMAKEVDDVHGDRIDDIRGQLLSLEGRAGSLYWDAVQKLVQGKSDFSGREHRGAHDSFNALLNYGYGILYSTIWGAIILAGLEPFAGFVHTDRPGKPSLCLDMVEEFRPRVVDRPVIAMVNKGFEVKMQDGKLSAETRHKVVEAVKERLESRELYHGKQHKLATIIQLQARSVASFLRGEGKYKPFVRRW